MSEITLPQRYSITTDISRCEALNRDRKFQFPSARRLPQFRSYLP